MRGLALLMIFVDHIPDNGFGWYTLHMFGFCDAAEVFVILAGFSSMMAYGRVLERGETAAGLRRIARRVVAIYLTHIGLLLTTLLVVRSWCRHFGIKPKALAPIIDSPVNGLLQAVTLQALPTYLDILPLYMVLLALFPLLWMGLRRRPLATLALSGAVWFATQLDPAIDLPNVLDDARRWYFNPFAWQFLFTLGAALAVLHRQYGGGLPRISWLRAASLAYLAAAFLMAAPWADWGLPSLMVLHVTPPEKSTLALPRILDILALTYVILGSERLRAVAASSVLRSARACGRHSLAVFALGCLLAVFGRLLFRTFGITLPMEVAVNAVGLSTMAAAGLLLEQRRVRAARRSAALLPAQA
jgi:hypothetical protein